MLLNILYFYSFKYILQSMKKKPKAFRLVEHNHLRQRFQQQFDLLYFLENTNSSGLQDLKSTKRNILESTLSTHHYPAKPPQYLHFTFKFNRIEPNCLSSFPQNLSIGIASMAEKWDLMLFHFSCPVDNPIENIENNPLSNRVYLRKQRIFQRSCQVN